MTGLEPGLSRVRRAGLLVSGLGGLGCVALSWLEPARFFAAYLVGFVFWLDVSLGLLFLLMLQHVLRSEWGRRTRPLLEASTAALPLLALAFVPVLLGSAQLYAWADEGGRALLPAHLRSYYAVPYVAGRAALYFALWLLLGWLLARHRARPGTGALQSTPAGLRRLCGFGIVVLVLSSTFAAIDWVRSLAPGWRSTTFGCYFLAGQALSALACLSLIAAGLRPRTPDLRARLTADVFQDLGKLMLTFVVLWSYIAFTQFLIVWSGNLPVETAYYVVRSRSGWQHLALALVLLHFALPFFLLLPRAPSRRPEVLAMIAAGILVMRLCDAYWLVGPSRMPRPELLPWPIVLTTLSLGGLWLERVLSGLAHARLDWTSSPEPVP